MINIDKNGGEFGWHRPSRFKTVVAQIVISFAVIVLLFLLRGGIYSRPITLAQRDLSGREAAQLAAKLANDRCEHMYRERPFTASQYSAELQNGTYHWGRLDVFGHRGFSALVTFRQNGGEPHVEVYFSSDLF